MIAVGVDTHNEIAALMAAKKVLANDGLCTPRAGGTRQALAALLIARRSCVSERTRLLNQLQALNTTAPVALRERVGEGNGRNLAQRLVKMRTRSDRPQRLAASTTALATLSGAALQRRVVKRAAGGTARGRHHVAALAGEALGILQQAQLIRRADLHV